MCLLYSTYLDVESPAELCSMRDCNVTFAMLQTKNYFCCELKTTFCQLFKDRHSTLLSLQTTGLDDRHFADFRVAFGLLLRLDLETGQSLFRRGVWSKKRTKSTFPALLAPFRPTERLDRAAAAGRPRIGRTYALDRSIYICEFKR